MSFYKFWHRPRRKTSGNGGQSGLSFDLFYQLSYMSAVAASGVSRGHIIEYASKLPCGSSRYFKEVNDLCQHLKYDLPEAMRIVGQSTKKEEVKGLLLRFSSSLASGESERDFLEREAKVQAEAYSNEYERRLESLRKWTDAYTALIFSAVLIVIVASVSMMIYSVATNIIVGMVGLMLVVSMLGAWIIRSVAPKEVKKHNLKPGSREQRLVETLSKVLIPVALVLCIFLTSQGTGAGWTLIVGAITVFPVGLLCVLDDRKIDRRDREVGSFLGSLGAVASAVGTTTTDALGRLDLRSVASLQPQVKCLKASLRSGIEPELCWRDFSSQTGSELVNRSVTIYQDATRMGADPEEVSQCSSLFAMKIALLRAKRKITASTFEWLSLALHGVIGALLVFVIQVVNGFGDTMGNKQEEQLSEVSGNTISGGVFSIGLDGMELLNFFIVPTLLVLVAANACAPKAAAGGHKYKLFFYLSITMAISGVILLILPGVVDIILGLTPSS